MKRRVAVAAFIAFGAAPVVVFSQTLSKAWRIGYLSIAAGPNLNVEAFRGQLRTLGYIEGRNLSIEFRWAAGKPERLSELAAELVLLDVDVIVTSGTQAAVAAKRATAIVSIPVVMAAVSDPVNTGLVASLARPGGNITGSTDLTNELVGKQLQVLH